MRSQLQLSPTTFPVGNLNAYIHRVNQVPMLTLEEELECARRLRDEDDLEGARRLITAHLRYVVRIARGYQGYGLALGDLIQEGNVGLMKAVKRFDPEMGVRLVSFAVHWIKAEIHEFILKNWRIVKVATTKAQRKLFFNLRKMKKRLGWMGHEEVDAVAKDLGVTRNDVLVMEQRLNAMDAAYDSAESVDEQPSYGVTASPARYLHDDSANPERIVEQESAGAQGNEQVHRALAHLDERSRDILQQRWLSDEKAVTLHELANKYGVSAERIRQLEKNAMNKMRQHIESNLIN